VTRRATAKLYCTYFRIPYVRNRFAIQALGLALTVAKNARIFVPHVGSSQRERQARDERIVRQRCRFPIISYAQEILK
jgi:hypothetical protein